jgi:hypothetical protein
LSDFSLWIGWAETVHKAIEIPAEPAAADDLPPLLKGFGAVPPLVTDLNLSLDDRFLYVSRWGSCWQGAVRRKSKLSGTRIVAILRVL